MSPLFKITVYVYTKQKKQVGAWGSYSELNQGQLCDQVNRAGLMRWAWLMQGGAGEQGEWKMTEWELSELRSRFLLL